MDGSLPTTSSESGASSTWGASGDAGLSIADMVAQAASEVFTEQLLPGFIYYQEYGMYYNHETGFYYDQNTSLFYHPSTKCYYYYNNETQSYVPYSKVEPGSHLTWKKKKYLKRALGLFGDDKVNEFDQENANIVEALFDLVDRCAFLYKGPVEIREEAKKRKDPSYMISQGNWQKLEDIQVICYQEAAKHRYDEYESDSDDDEQAAMEEMARRKAEEEEMSKHPPCIRVIELSNDNKLHIVTISGANIGFALNCDIRLSAFVGFERYHLKITYQNDAYIMESLSAASKIPIWINANQLEGYYKIQHEDMITIGPHRLLCHIHTGTNTCNGCEPGLLPKQPKAPEEDPKIVRKRNTEAARRQTNKAIKEAYGLLGAYSDEDEPKGNYKDRAKIRRITKGFDIPGAKKIVSSHTGIYAGCQAAPIPGASAASVTLKTGPKPQAASLAVPISSENKGFNLLKKMGWKEGEGLGRERQGIANPIMSMVKTDRAGLGSEISKPIDPSLPKKSAKEIEREEIFKKMKERYDMTKVPK